MEQKKTSPTRAKKEKIVAKLSEKVSRAKGLVFANYQGLTHVQLENLKRKVKSLNADLVVTKNTLLKLALGKGTTGLKGTTSTTGSSPRDTRDTRTTRATFELEGPTATLFLYADPIEPLKALAKTIKELNLLTVKLAFIEGKELTSDEVLKLATLPSRETLLTQLVFGLKSPIFGLHRALNWNIQKLVLTLKAIESKKS